MSERKLIFVANSLAFTQPSSLPGDRKQRKTEKMMMHPHLHRYIAAHTPAGSRDGISLAFKHGKTTMSAPRTWQCLSDPHGETLAKGLTCVQSLGSSAGCLGRAEMGSRLVASRCSSIYSSAGFTLNRYDKTIIRAALQFVRCLVRTTFLPLLLSLGLTGWFALA